MQQTKQVVNPAKQRRREARAKRAAAADKQMKQERRIKQLQRELPSDKKVFDRWVHAPVESEKVAVKRDSKGREVTI